MLYNYIYTRRKPEVQVCAAVSGWYAVLTVTESLTLSVPGTQIPAALCVHLCFFIQVCLQFGIYMYMYTALHLDLHIMCTVYMYIQSVDTLYITLQLYMFACARMNECAYTVKHPIMNCWTLCTAVCWWLCYTYQGMALSITGTAVNSRHFLWVTVL